jgi:mannitol/fructose-specific phosphotransferase system IIA component
VHLCGKVLLECGAIEPQYIDAMWQREQILSSFIGERTAIPHGTDESRKYVNFAQLVFLRFPEAIDWDGDFVNLTIGIASANNEHVDTLAVLAELLMDSQSRQIMFNSEQPNEILELVQKAYQEL